MGVVDPDEPIPVMIPVRTVINPPKTFWEDLLGRLTSRKLWLTIIASVTAYLAAMQDGQITPQEMSMVLAPILVYLGLNTAAEIAEKLK